MGHGHEQHGRCLGVGLRQSASQKIPGGKLATCPQACVPNFVSISLPPPRSLPNTISVPSGENDGPMSFTSGLSDSNGDARAVTRDPPDLPGVAARVHVVLAHEDQRLAVWAPRRGAGLFEPRRTEGGGIAHRQDLLA